MISSELNERLTRVGPGTPAGEFLRRYWLPVAGSSEIASKGTKRVRVLGEDLALYRDASGTIGLLQERCPHRGCSLVAGIPEMNGLRCPYHGWLFDETGTCLEQPAEPETSKFKDRVKASAYRLEELGGLVWAYMGPEPAPLLPRFDLYALGNGWRTIGYTDLPCNWLQIMENSLDPTHVEYLHGRLGDYALELAGEPPTSGITRHHLKIGFDEFEYGIIKRRIVEGMTEEHDEWSVGHPMVLPITLRVGRGPWSQFQIRLPVDDTHTHIWWYSVVEVDHPVDQPGRDVPVHEVPYLDEQGRHILTSLEGQDMMAWVSQGPIADRTIEHIGTSDKGVAMFRRVLEREYDRVARGEDPLGTIRDPAQNDLILLPQGREGFFQNAGEARMDILRQPGIRTSPIAEQLVEAYLEAIATERVS